MVEFMNNVLAFGFILNQEQMKKLLLNFYKNTNTNEMVEKDWRYILDFNKKRDYIFLNELLEKYPELENLKLYYDCYAKNSVLFSIKTIFNSCGEIPENKNKRLPIEKMMEFKKDNEKDIYSFLNKNNLENVSCDWYTFSYEWS